MEGKQDPGSSWLTYAITTSRRGRCHKIQILLRASDEGYSLDRHEGAAAIHWILVQEGGAPLAAVGMVPVLCRMDHIVAISSPGKHQHCYVVVGLCRILHSDRGYRPRSFWAGKRPQGGETSACDGETNSGKQREEDIIEGDTETEGMIHNHA